MNGIEISTKGEDGQVVTTTPVPASPTATPVKEPKTEKGKGTGSGRRKGSFSFAFVSLPVLVNKFAPGFDISKLPDVRVKASRVWLEEHDISEAVAAPANQPVTTVPVAEPEAPSPVQFEVS